jgi:DNA-binding CsgD family transcriptional regulator
MFPDRSILLEQIVSVIRKNSAERNLTQHSSSAISESAKGDADTTDKFHYFFSEKNDLLKKLEQRVQTLEEQDDRLLHFVHFLFENLAGMVRDILLSCPEVYENKKAVANEAGRKNLTNGEGKKDQPNITPREMDVLNLLIKGLCAKEIAESLFISETTVITHKKHLKEKFNARNSAELISKALFASG